MNELLPDRWQSRDQPILLAAARATEAGEAMLVEPLAEQLGVRFRDVMSAMTDLRESYLDAHFTRSDGGKFTHIRLADQGRRAVGLWPA